MLISSEPHDHVRLLSIYGIYSYAIYELMRYLYATHVSICIAAGV